MARQKGSNVVDLVAARRKRAAGGEKESATYSELIDRIYRDHNEALIRFLYVKLRSEQDAREVAQEAYVRMLKLDEPDTVRHLQSYLFRTAANLAVDRLRQGQRRPTVAVPDDGPREPCSPLPAQDHILEGRQKLSLLETAITELPPKCRKAFLLYKFEGRSYGDIADEMGLSESMIRKYVIRVLVYCRERLGDEL